MLNTPVLYIMFNRPELVKRTFPEIVKQQPRQLFIASDGPRDTHPDDSDKVMSCRDWVLSQIDWECDTKVLFRDQWK